MRTGDKGHIQQSVEPGLGSDVAGFVQKETSQRGVEDSSDTGTINAAVCADFGRPVSIIIERICRHH